jgi:hypothetical protein
MDLEIRKQMEKIKLNKHYRRNYAGTMHASLSIWIVVACFLSVTDKPLNAKEQEQENSPILHCEAPAHTPLPLNFFFCERPKGFDRTKTRFHDSKIFKLDNKYIISYDKNFFTLDLKENVISDFEIINSLPSGVKLSPDYQLVADDNVIAVVNDGVLFFYQKGTWSKVDLSNCNDCSLLEATSKRMLRMNNSLYLAYDYGEKGGYLLRVDLQTHQATRIKLGSRISTRAVTDLGFDQRGDLWASMGLVHSTIRSGGVYHIQGETAIPIFEKLQMLRDESDFAQAGRTQVVEISAIAFDRQGRLFSAGMLSGISRWNGRSWTRLTPWWFPVSIGNFLIDDDGTFVIATGTAGVLIWRPGDPVVRRLIVPERRTGIYHENKSINFKKF